MVFPKRNQKIIHQQRGKSNKIDITKEATINTTNSNNNTIAGRTQRRLRLQRQTPKQKLQQQEQRKQQQQPILQRQQQNISGGSRLLGGQQKQQQQQQQQQQLLQLQRRQTTRKRHVNVSIFIIVIVSLGGYSLWNDFSLSNPYYYSYDYSLNTTLLQSNNNNNSTLFSSSSSLLSSLMKPTNNDNSNSKSKSNDNGNGNDNDNDNGSPSSSSSLSKQIITKHHFTFWEQQNAQEMSQWRKTTQEQCQMVLDKKKEQQQQQQQQQQDLFLEEKAKLEQMATQRLVIPNSSSSSSLSSSTTTAITSSSASLPSSSSKPSTTTTISTNPPYNPFCKHAFIDLGTNIGDSIGYFIDNAIDVCTPMWLQQQQNDIHGGNIRKLDKSFPRPYINVLDPTTIYHTTSTNTTTTTTRTTRTQTTATNTPQSSKPNPLFGMLQTQMKNHYRIILEKEQQQEQEQDQDEYSIQQPQHELQLQSQHPLLYSEDFCVYGVEGNPEFTGSLQKLQNFIMNQLRPRPIRHLHIFTESVIAAKDGPTKLYLDKLSVKQNFWGSSILESQQDAQKSAKQLNNGQVFSADVQGIRLSTLIRNTMLPFAQNNINTNNFNDETNTNTNDNDNNHNGNDDDNDDDDDDDDDGGGLLIIKMDVEGAEYQVLKEIAASGVLCDYINNNDNSNDNDNNNPTTTTITTTATEQPLKKKKKHKKKKNRVYFIVEYHNRSITNPKQRRQEKQGHDEAKRKLQECGVEFGKLQAHWH